MMIICYFFFSPADISFLRSISLSISLEILSIGYPCISLCRSNIGVSHHLAILSMGISAEIKKSAEAVPTLVIGQVFLFPYGYSQFVNLKP